MKKNNDKPWYEKVGTWVGIIAGACAIITFIFNACSIDDSNSDILKNSNNEINTGDRSIIMIGDKNTFIHKSDDSDNIQESETNNFSVVATYDINTPQTSIEGINVLIEAETTFPAKRVTILASSDEVEVEKDMHGGSYKWQFLANFYIKGTYTITVTAYDSEGNKVSDSFEYVY